jgi:hypothetical protein
MRKGLIAIFFIFLALSICHAEAIEFVIENSPYYVQKDLLVKKEDTLVVEPGVVIEMAKDASVIIEGRVNIAGYPRGGEVIFKAARPYQNYHKGFWQGVVIASNQENTIEYAVVQHAKIGIEIKTGASAEIRNNIITQNKTGIRAEGAKKLSIMQNSFLGNFIDIEMEDTAGLLDRNYFEGSLTALILKQGYPLIEKNNFKQVHKNLVECYNEDDLFASENFWACGQEEEIKKRILQGGKGEFIFKPFSKELFDLSKEVE